MSEKQPGIGEGAVGLVKIVYSSMKSASARLSNVVRSARSGLVLVERHFSLGKTHKICSLELEEWWLDFFF